MVHVRIASGHSVRVSGHGNIGRSALRLRSGRASDSRLRALRFGAQAVVGPRPDIPASAAARAVATRLLGTYPNQPSAAQAVGVMLDRPLGVVAKVARSLYNRRHGPSTAVATILFGVMLRPMRVEPG